MSPGTHFTVLALVVLAAGIGGLFVLRHMSHKLDKEQRNGQRILAMSTRAARLVKLCPKVGDRLFRRRI